MLHVAPSCEDVATAPLSVACALLATVVKAPGSRKVVASVARTLLLKLDVLKRTTTKMMSSASGLARSHQC